MPLVDVHPPRPVETPVMYQVWECLTFLHWRYDAGEIQARLPAGLEVDVFDGSAWVGLTPFRVAGLRPPFLPPLPWVSAFPETNVRTYVCGPGGERGIWFFSLEAGRLLAVAGARATYGLPYRWADMSVKVSGDFAEYASRRRRPYRPATNRVRVRIGRPIEAGDAEAFLTARFRLYTTLFGRLAFADVEHEPWPLRGAIVDASEGDLIQNSGLPRPRGEPIAHYSPGVTVRIGSPQCVKQEDR